MNADTLFQPVRAIGSFIVRRFVKKEEIRDRHFTRIKKEILWPWLDKIKLDDEIEERRLPHVQSEDFSILKEYGSANKELFKDSLINHFSELKTLRKSLDKLEAKFSRKISKISNKLSSDFGKREFYEDTLKRFFIIGQEKYLNVSLMADYDYLMFGASMVCHSNQEDSEKIKKRLEKMYNAKQGRDLRKLSDKIKDNRRKLISEVERALASEKLKGECDFLK